MNKNLIILTLSQIFSFTAAPVTVFLSGIIGSQISPLKSLSTLPMSISVVGIAIGSIFATKVMSLIGRKATEFLFILLCKFFYWCWYGIYTPISFCCS